MERLTFKNFNYNEEPMKRLQELEDKLENGQLVELPCKVGDTVYGVGFNDCEDAHTTDEKKKRKIFNVCNTMNGRCDKCEYGRPKIEEFVCTHIQISAEPTLIVGQKCENYFAENVFTDKIKAEARLKELQEK